ncbi:MAG: hypothetical protein EXS13_00480 [Planctomycetes bacterium]|nr:hypothetical protein [Planctomycetota bacterium]
MGGGTRLLHVVLVFLAVAAAIGQRLATLQFEQREFWEAEAVKARTRAETLGFKRGAILDCDGRPIASNRTTRNLAFVFGGFRRGAACGQLLLTHYLLTGERCGVAEVVAHPDARIGELAKLTIGELRRIEPGQRREDLLWYGAWLVEDESIKDGIERLRAGDPAQLAFPRIGAAHSAIATRVSAEAATLRQLTRALSVPEDELIERMDLAIAAADARVLRRMAEEGPVERAYERERALHRELDHRDALLFANVAHAAVFDLAADPSRLPGLVVREEPRRIYPPENDVGAALIGRVGPPSEATLKPWNEKRNERDVLALEPFPTLEQAMQRAELDDALRLDVVAPDEEVGREGLELTFEAALRGRRGYRRTENDRAGRVERELEVAAPRPGRDLVLTLDVELQKAAEAVLRRGFVKKGETGSRLGPAAFALVELPSMAIRVIASWPAPGRAELADQYETLANNKTTRPLHPRAWRPWLPPPPGSSVKPIVAAFALSAGIITPQKTLACDKLSLRAKGESKPVLCESEHFQIDVHDALVKSCNHFFARVAYSAGSERMVGWLRSVGLGQRAGFTAARLADGTEFPALAIEVAGTVEQERGGRNLMLLGLGQGKVDATPLQMAAAMGALALRSWQPPTLIARVGDEVPFRPAVEPLPISDAAWECVVEAMRAVTLPGGTASPSHGADLTPWDLATKTGTPQQAGGLSHSWLVGFLPSHAPRYAFAIFVERTGMHGGDAAAPFLHALLTDPAFAEISAAARRSDYEAAAARLAVRPAGGTDEESGDPISDDASSVDGGAE